MLSGARVNAQDKLFATLDPTMRAITLPSGRNIILSDTVGFVSSLPTQLVASFRATLDEVLEADLIVHVRDIAHPDTNAQSEDVMSVLDELGVGEAAKERILEVRNKIDLIQDYRGEVGAVDDVENGDFIALSALTGDGEEDLRQAIDVRLAKGQKVLEVSLSLMDGAAIAWLYNRGEVFSRLDDERSAHMRVGLDHVDAARFEHRFTAKEI